MPNGLCAYAEVRHASQPTPHVVRTRAKAPKHEPAPLSSNRHDQDTVHAQTLHGRQPPTEVARTSRAWLMHTERWHTRAHDAGYDQVWPLLPPLSSR